MFKKYKIKNIRDLFYKIYFAITIVAAIISLAGFSSNAGVLNTISGSVFLWIVALLTLSKKFRESSFSFLLCSFTVLYINIPVAFILYKGDDYQFGEGLAFLLYQQSEYTEILWLAMITLLVAWCAIWMAIIFNIKKPRLNIEKCGEVKSWPIVLMTVVVAFITIRDNIGFRKAVNEGISKSESILAFLFFDHAFLVLAGLLLTMTLNNSNHNLAKNNGKVLRLAASIFIIFVITTVVAGSKAAILIVFLLFIFYPITLFAGNPNSNIIFPSAKMIIILSILSPIMFYVALLNRSSPKLDGFDMATYFNILDGDIFYELINNILYRLAYGGIDRFVLLFKTSVFYDYDFDSALNFCIYVSRNLFNLLAPGTPFPEAYAPSSQLFTSVIHNYELNGVSDSASLVENLNSQPYTVFGLFSVICGKSFIIFLFLFNCGYFYIFNRINSIFIKVTLLYFYASLLSSYGVEVAVANSIHVYISLLLMYKMMRIMSKLAIRRPSSF